MRFDKLISILKKDKIEENIFFNYLEKCQDSFFDTAELELELLLSNGFPIFEEDGKYFLKTAHTNYNDEIYCIVDIETTGGKPTDSSIIEVAGIKIQNNQIIDTFEELVYTKEIPIVIEELTGIKTEDVQSARRCQDVLASFKIFLSDTIFVAHDVKFDYNFISYYMKKYSLGELKNRKLCTIQLAKKTIEAQRYGLSYLNEELNINHTGHHRALQDVMTTKEVFYRALENIPKHVISTENLIDFSCGTLKKAQN
jgi:DNA polymerase-3 subunit epsilon